MKNTFRKITSGSVVALALGALCCTGSAFAAEETNTSTMKKEATEKKESMKEKTASMMGKETGKLAEDDKEFLTKAAKGGMEEVQMGKMAEKNGQSAEVKSFGKMMVNDHSKANKELMALAKKKGVTLDTNVKAEKIDGSKFDHEYMEEMVKDHEKDVAEFAKAEKKCKDAEVKAFASKTLPTLKHHLEMAKSTKAKVDKKS